MRVLSILLLVVGLAFGAWVFLQSLLSSPLQAVGGDLHDFGVVLIDGSKETVEHTFVLENTSDRTLSIVKTVPSCGCTWAKPGENTVLPGEQLELPVTLEVKESHKIDSNIKIILEEDSPLTLWLSARGRRSNSLRHTPEFIRLRSLSPKANGHLFIEQWTEDRPPEPTIEAPGDLTVDFKGWTLSSRGKERLGTPDHYKGAFVVKSGDEQAPLNGKILFTMPDGQKTMLLVNPPNMLRDLQPGSTIVEPGTPEFEFNPVQPGTKEPADPPQETPGTKPGNP